MTHTHDTHTQAHTHTHASPMQKRFGHRGDQIVHPDDRASICIVACSAMSCMHAARAVCVCACNPCCSQTTQKQLKMSSSSDQNPFRVLGPLGPTLPLPPSYGPVRRNKRNPYEVENERVVREQQAMLLEEDLARRIRDHEWGTAT